MMMIMIMCIPMELRSNGPWVTEKSTPRLYLRMEESLVSAYIIPLNTVSAPWDKERISYLEGDIIMSIIGLSE